MYRLLFAIPLMHLFWKSLICIRPFSRLASLPWPCWEYARAFVSLPVKTNCSQLGSQTLGAALFRSMHVRFTNIITDCGSSNRSRKLLVSPVKFGA